MCVCTFCLSAGVCVCVYSELQIQSGYAKSLQLNWFFSTITIILSFEFQLLLLFCIYIVWFMVCVCVCMATGIDGGGGQCCFFFRFISRMFAKRMTTYTRPISGKIEVFSFFFVSAHRFCVERRDVGKTMENLKYIRRSIEAYINYSPLVKWIWFKYFGRDEWSQCMYVYLLLTWSDHKIMDHAPMPAWNA